MKPNSKKTVDSPMTKNNAGKIARPVFAFGSLSVTPPIYARYGGTIGSTQGDRKDNRPAIRATSIAGTRLASMISKPNMPLPLAVARRGVTGQRLTTAWTW